MLTVSGPDSSEAILVSAAHCNFVCQVILDTTYRHNSTMFRMSLTGPALRFVAVVNLPHLHPAKM